MVLRSESSSEFNVFDAFIVSKEAADCLRVPHAGPILVLLPDAMAAEALWSLDLGDLMSSMDLNQPDVTKHSCEE